MTRQLLGLLLCALAQLAAGPGAVQAQPTSPTPAEAPPHRQEEAYRSYLGLPDRTTLMLRDGLDTDDAIGAQVVGPGGETIGPITDLLVDEGGRIVRAIIDVGASVGAGSKPVAVELDRLRRAEDHLVLDIGAERLAALPEYRKTGDRWVRGPWGVP
jgi:hypothetical protein